MSKPDTSENGKCRFSRALLIASAVLALLLVASLALRLYTNDQINIFSMAEYGKSLQNNRILVAEDKGITYLGTYQNTVLALIKRVKCSGLTLLTVPLARCATMRKNSG